jgi:hypothetical protein
MPAVVPPAPQGEVPVAVADTLGSEDDLEPSVEDSAVALSDSTDSSADSVAVPADEAWLETLYASVETDFPNTPFAERARRLRQALNGLRVVEVEADSASVPDVPDAEIAQADSRRSAEEALRGDAPLEARDPIDTWSIYTSSTREWAAEILQYTADAGYRTALYFDEREAIYHVIVGQFATRTGAQAARAEVEAIPDAESPRLLRLNRGTVLEQPGEVLPRGDQ